MYIVFRVTRDVSSSFNVTLSQVENNFLIHCVT
jgi:hypothetical protein